MVRPTPAKETADFNKIFASLFELEINHGIPIQCATQPLGIIVGGQYFARSVEQGKGRVEH